MTTTHSFAHRQSGRFLVGWLVGVGLGTALVGVGLYLGFDYLSTTPTAQVQPLSVSVPVPVSRTANSTGQPRKTNISVPPRVAATPNRRVRANAQQQTQTVQYQPQASAAPASPGYARTREGEVIEVPEGETTDSVLDRHAREQNLSVAIDRAISAADRNKPVPTEVVRQQQERVAAARVQDAQRREQYEQELRAQDAQRRKLMREEDVRRGIEPDPDEEDEIAPRQPD